MKVRDRISVDQGFLVAMGTTLLCLSLAGVIHGTGAAWAARLSCRAQLAQPPLAVEQVVAWCYKAYTLYPWNYYFSIYTAELAYYQADAVSGPDRAERLRQARIWCDRGLVQNPFKSQLRRLKTRFIWEESPSEAIAYWKAYTDWQYWEPYNHATLAEMYSRYGEADKAEAELRIVRGDPMGYADYEKVRAAVAKENSNWANLAEGKAVEWGE